MHDETHGLDLHRLKEGPKHPWLLLYKVDHAGLNATLVHLICRWQYLAA